MYKYLVFLNDRLLGVGNRSTTFRDGVHYEPIHEAFCCPVCGEVWARCVAEGSNGPWQFTPWRCEKHGIGTLWLPVADHNKALPVEALEREFLLACDYPVAWYFGGWARRDAEIQLPEDSLAESQESLTLLESF